MSKSTVSLIVNVWLSILNTVREVRWIWMIIFFLCSSFSDLFDIFLTLTLPIFAGTFIWDKNLLRRAVTPVLNQVFFASWGVWECQHVEALTSSCPYFDNIKWAFWRLAEYIDLCLLAHDLFPSVKCRRTRILHWALLFLKQSFFFLL